MQRLPRDDGVSPLIATILLIAIAVALGTIVLTISETLAEETIPEAPPSTAFTIKDHNDPINATTPPDPPNSYHTKDDCSDRLFLIKVDEDIRLRDFRIRIGQDDAFFDVWGENDTMQGNVNETFKLFVDNFPQGPGGNDYELVVDQAETDFIEAGTSFVLREVFYDIPQGSHPNEPDVEEAKNQACSYFQFGDEVQVQIIHASGDELVDVAVKLQ